MNEYDYDNLNNDYGRNNVQPQYSSSAIAASVPSVMRRVYVKMFMAMLVTAAASLFAMANPAVLGAIYSSKWSLIALVGVEFGLVIWLSAAMHKLSNTAASLLFYLYSAINGLVLTSIFFVYSPSSILLTFCITAGVFGAMSIYGYVTRADLSKFGAIMFMALIGLIIASVVNIFLQSDQMTWIISLAGVGIFIGLTAWDTQKIKRLAEQTDASMTSKVATMGALTLYLDFINLFLYLLRIFGDRR